MKISSKPLAAAAALLLGGCMVGQSAVEPAGRASGQPRAIRYKGMTMKISSKPLAAAAALLLGGCM
ncbi:hypothetical protein, partial [Caballeronia sp. M23-90]